MASNFDHVSAERDSFAAGGWRRTNSEVCQSVLPQGAIEFCHVDRPLNWLRLKLNSCSTCNQKARDNNDSQPS